MITVMSETSALDNRRTIIIDAGHGGVDGGATSCSGILESKTNLEIALRLNDLMHLLGMNTLMIRTSDMSVYTEGNSIAAKKVSDLKERVRIVNTAENAILVSIHQNHFTDSRYSGAQVFFSNNSDSISLSEKMQDQLIKSLNQGSRRRAKKADGIYLMQKINCPGILIECGFISNPVEDAKLNSAQYQKKLCCVISSVISNFSYQGSIA